MKKGMKLVCMVLTLAMLLGLLAGCGGKGGDDSNGGGSDQTLLLGLIGPMTGDYAHYGTSTRDGAQVAVEEINAAGGVNGWQLKLELPDEELPVCADPDMMQRALHNLLGNAMHHIGEDGIFVLRALRCPEGVRVEVEDHGPGISAEDLPYIFDRYYRSRSDAGKQGTGLGLSITKAIFQQHGFRFGVHSTVGRGTVFWFIMTDAEETSA